MEAIFLYELVKWEFRKICGDKKNRIASVVCTIGMLVITYAAISNNAAYMQDWKLISGTKAIKQQKEFQKSLEGELTEERIAKDIKHFQDNRDVFLKKVGPYEEWTTEGEQYFNPRKDYFALLNNNYYFGEEDETGYANLLKVQLIGDNAQFYATRDEMVYDMLFDEETVYNKKEAMYWMKHYNALDDTIYYGDSFGWQQILFNAQALLIPLFLVCFCLSSVFAGEYENNTYSILLTTKTGKDTLVWAKKVAALAFALLLFTIELIIYHVLTLVLCGVEGANYKVQTCGVLCPYNITYGQAVLINIAISYLVLLTITMLTLCISSKSKSILPGFFLVVVGIVGIMFLPQPVTYGMMQLRVLLPNTVIGLFTYAGGGAISYVIGNVVLNVMQMAAVVYGIGAFLLFLIAGRSFKTYC